MKPRRPTPGPLAQIALRVPADVLERAAELVPRLNARPEHQARGAVTRSDVLRLALVRGLLEIERETRARSPRKPPTLCAPRRTSRPSTTRAR